MSSQKSLHDVIADALEFVEENDIACVFGGCPSLDTFTIIGLADYLANKLDDHFFTEDNNVDRSSLTQRASALIDALRHESHPGLPNEIEQYWIDGTLIKLERWGRFWHLKLDPKLPSFGVWEDGKPLPHEVRKIVRKVQAAHDQAEGRSTSVYNIDNATTYG